ncbi:hypothetical protein RB653_006054 [Dictyostelium firmibasis]|uniref:Rap-GAP domain-containing protein n=1 Tax=Dictyostelium firmibasis TaxID=79012 RepID=A0AAN7UCT6_9MYCE
MFLDWASSIHLLGSDKNTGILKDFPLSVKRILVFQTVNFLLEPPNGNTQFIVTSKEHLQWIMEITEQGFLLPIEDNQIILQCIELYKKWLFDPKHKPLPLTEDKDEYFHKKIIEHLTLIFQPRSYPHYLSISNNNINNNNNNNNGNNNNNNSNNSSSPNNNTSVNRELNNSSNNSPVLSGTNTGSGSSLNLNSKDKENSGGSNSGSSLSINYQQSSPPQQTITSSPTTPVKDSSQQQFLQQEVGGFNEQQPQQTSGTVKGSKNHYRESVMPNSSMTVPSSTTALYSTNSYSGNVQLPTISVKELIDNHSVLCQKVLQIYLEMSRGNYSRSFSTDTLEHWNRLMLSITDCILGVHSNSDEMLARNLCPLLLKTLFEVWLQSKTLNPSLWNSLSKYAQGWFHHMPTVNQWNLTCLALTTPLVQSIYTNDHQSKSTITIRLDETIIEFDREYLYYAWNRILNLIGNPNQIKSPSIFSEAITGIFHLVSIFLSVTNDGNAILHIFGSWIFEAVKTIKPGFDEGISLGSEILLHIFLSCSRKIQFLPIYLSCFYTCISEALWCDGKILRDTIIHSQNIFSSGLPGSRILIPSYTRALNHILTAQGTNDPELRRCAIKILGSILCLPNRYETIKFHNFFPGRTIDPYPPLPNDIIDGKHNELTQPPNEISTYDDLKPHLAYLILSALNTEMSSSNLLTLIWYIMFFQLEYQHQHVKPYPDGKSITSAFIHQSINTILKKCSSFTNQWSHDVILSSFQLLSDLAAQHQRIPNFLENASTVVRKLCKFITFKCKETNMSPETEDLIALGCSTIADWVVVSPWIFEGNYLTDTSTFYMVFNALSVAMGAKSPNDIISSNASISSSIAGITSMGSGGSGTGSGGNQSSQPSSTGSASGSGGSGGNAPSSSSSSNSGSFKRSKPYINNYISPKVKEVAQCALKAIMSKISYFPNPYHATPTNTSSKVTESDIIAQIKAKAEKHLGIKNYPSEQSLRFYAIGDSIIITVIDQPFTATSANPSDSYVTLIIRDMSGKSIVNSQLAFLPFKQREISETQQPITNEKEPQMDEGDDPVPATSSTDNASTASSTTASIAIKRSYNCNEEPFISSYVENVEEFGDLSSYIEKHMDENFTKLIDSQMQVEQQKLSANKYSLGPSITSHPPILKSSFNGDCKLQQARILLTHLGFLNQENKNKLTPLENSVQFFQSLNMLDSVSERVQIKIPIIYVKKGDVTEDDIYNNVTSDTTQDYQDFIASLGWLVPISTHTGFLSDLDKKNLTHGQFTPYYATHSREIVFFVSTMMPNCDGANNVSQEHKKKLISKTNVSVIWYDGPIEVYEKTLLESFPHAIQIVITPLENNLFRLKTLRKAAHSNRMKTGPVNDEIIISKHILSNVIRLSVVNSNQSLLNLSTGDSKAQHQYTNRKKLISDITESFKHDMTIQKFYEFHFEPLNQTHLYQNTENLPMANNFKFVKNSSVNLFRKDRTQSALIGTFTLPPPPVSPTISPQPSPHLTGSGGSWASSKGGPTQPTTPSGRTSNFLSRRPNLTQSEDSSNK